MNKLDGNIGLPPNDKNKLPDIKDDKKSGTLPTGRKVDKAGKNPESTQSAASQLTSEMRREEKTLRRGSFKQKQVWEDATQKKSQDPKKFEMDEIEDKIVKTRKERLSEISTPKKEDSPKVPKVISPPEAEQLQLRRRASSLKLAGRPAPNFYLGMNNPSSDAVDKHRNPINPNTLQAFTDKEINALSLTNIRDEKIKAQSKEIYKSEKNIANDADVPADWDRNWKLNPRALARLKEKCNEEVYNESMKRNIDSGLYNPSAIAAEIRKDLSVDNRVPPIKTLENAKEAIKTELDKFQPPSFDVKAKENQVLTHELRHHLEADVFDTMDLYLKVYPNKTAEDAFVLGRDLARNAIYQVIHDKQSFTGSDHGVLHVHHNCKNGEHMHEKMDKEDISDRAKLLSRIMHFYHDIGYSVGSGTSFVVMKDHPFVGGAFIEANKKYFDHYLDAESTVILRRSIVNHAIVSFDNEKGKDYENVRFSTSNSDACAVTADQKTQSFWRENPETLLSLARLRQFLTIYPQMGGRDKLSHGSIMKNPEIPLPLKPGVDKARFFSDPPLEPHDFINPLDHKAWTVYKSVRDELMAIADKQHLPKEEQKAFKLAIEENFNSFSGDIVLAQYGAELNDVSVSINNAEGPKYIPRLEMSPSILFGFLQSCYSRETAGKNISKVCNEEYYADPSKIDEALDKVGNKGYSGASVNIPSPVADIYITPRKKTEELDLSFQEKQRKIINDKKLKAVETQLSAMQIGVTPSSARKHINNLILKPIPTTEQKFTEYLNELDKAKTFFDATLTQDQVEQEIFNNLTDTLNEFTNLIAELDSDPTKWQPNDVSKFKIAVSELQIHSITAKELEIMKV